MSPRQTSHGTAAHNPPAIARRAAGNIGLRAPTLLALSIFGLVAGVGAHAAKHFTFESGFTVAEAELIDRQAVVVRHPGGVIARVHVAVGEQVTAKQLLATIEAGEIDTKIALLRAQSEAAKLQLDSVRRETQAFNVLLDQRLISHTKVEALERQAAELEREANGVLARIGEAERQLASIEVRAPIAGVVQQIPGLVTGRMLEMNEPAAVIAPDPERLVVEALLTPRQMQAAEASKGARVWFDVASWRDGRTASARLVWSGPVSTGATFAARFELETNASRQIYETSAMPASKVRIVVPEGRRELVQQILDPMRRLAVRTSRHSSSFGG